MAKTKIDWATESWNPIKAKIGNTITGWHCEKISVGCRNCYAEKINRRFGNGRDYKFDKDIEFAADYRVLENPLHWKKPRRVFVESMGDLFHENINFRLIDLVFKVIKAAPEHTFIILTKRPNVAFRYYYLSNVESFTLKNIWYGVTVETNATAQDRIPFLFQVPAAVRFVSAEPLLGYIDIGRLVDWVICGSESGVGRRQTDKNWISYLLRQREGIIPFFLKQMEVGGKIVKMPKFNGRVWGQYPGDNGDTVYKI